MNRSITVLLCLITMSMMNIVGVEKTVDKNIKRVSASDVGILERKFKLAKSVEEKERIIKQIQDAHYPKQAGILKDQLAVEKERQAKRAVERQKQQELKRSASEEELERKRKEELQRKAAVDLKHAEEVERKKQQEALKQQEASEKQRLAEIALRKKEIAKEDVIARESYDHNKREFKDTDAEKKHKKLEKEKEKLENEQLNIEFNQWFRKIMEIKSVKTRLNELGNKISFYNGKIQKEWENKYKKEDLPEQYNEQTAKRMLGSVEFEHYRKVNEERDKIYQLCPQLRPKNIFSEIGKSIATWWRGSESEETKQIQAECQKLFEQEEAGTLPQKELVEQSAKEAEQVSRTEDGKLEQEIIELNTQLKEIENQITEAFNDSNSLYRDSKSWVEGVVVDKVTYTDAIKDYTDYKAKLQEHRDKVNSLRALRGVVDRGWFWSRLYQGDTEVTDNPLYSYAYNIVEILTRNE